MKISTRSWCTWLLVAGVAVISSCKHERAQSKPGAIPIRHAFALDRAGKSMTVDFWLRQGEADLKRRVIIGVEYPHAYGDVNQFVEAAEPRVRIDAWKVGQAGVGRMGVIDMNDLYASHGRSSPQRTDVARSTRNSMQLHRHAYDGVTEYVIAGSFIASDYGHYRVSVETAYDLPVFKDVPTEVVITQMYNMGK